MKIALITNLRNFMSWKNTTENHLKFWKIYAKVSNGK